MGHGFSGWLAATIGENKSRETFDRGHTGKRMGLTSDVELIEVGRLRDGHAIDQRYDLTSDVSTRFLHIG
jgi:hypothetical protein